MNPAAIGRPMEILLIEDNLGDARLTYEALREGHFKHRLTLISDGAEAADFVFRRKQYAQAPRPDLILLDLNLPRLSGAELLAEIRENEELSRIPIVVLTVSNSHEAILREQKLAVEGYLTKPVDLDQFLTLVKQLRRYWQEDLIMPA